MKPGTVRLRSMIGVVAAGLNLAAPTRASEAGRVSLIEENDSFVSSDDRHYTQGLRLSYLSGDITAGDFWDMPFTALANIFPIFQSEPPVAKRKIEGMLGQSIFTPENKQLGNPDPRDRPYVGWLYAGASLLQDDGRSLQDAELMLGVVGPSAFAKQVQNDFHHLLAVGESHGWGYQLNDEPGLVLSYERKWRFGKSAIGNLAVDVVPEVGISLGNVLTYGEAGGLVRLGQNLAADYGPARIRPNLSGSGWFDADRMETPFGWYLFVGVQGRAVARNIFLDGNTWQSSRHVDKQPLVADIVYGASLFWTDKVRVDASINERSKEFYGQHFEDRFGSITLSFFFW